MSSNKFDQLLADFKSEFSLVTQSKTLEELRENYTNFQIKRENVFEWVMTSIDDDDMKGEYLTNFSMFEHHLWIDKNTGNVIGEIPIFDENDIEDIFDEYDSYFQRYGCLTVDQIVSWDKQNVLFDDEFGNIDIIKRPDVLLNV
jgi:hypothetical protein